MTDRSVLIRVPATVGNFGGPSGNAAMALDAALNVRASTRRDGRVSIRYFGPNGERVPRDSNNLTVRALRAALESRDVPFGGIELEVYGSAPVGVGLGSSTSAVWAGLLAADRLYRLNLEEKALFDLAEGLEPRRDNLRAAWSGGFVARIDEGAGSVYRSTTVPDELELHVVIPDRPASETVEPGGSQRQVSGLAEALRPCVPGVEAIFVCGDGPSVGILTRREAAATAERAVGGALRLHGVNSTVSIFRPTNSGAREWNAGGSEIRLAPMVAFDMPEHRPLPV